jgi:succinyl-diaminopimelate desuccinylase
MCRIGSGRPSPSLLVMCYTTSQHGNYTDPRLEGQLANGREYGFDEDCVFGKGTSQNKGALAAMLGALKIIADAKVEMRGTLFFVVNAESQSSHRCSVRVIDGHKIRADCGWLAIGSPRIVIGYRGRVDIHVRIRGEAGHSSRPHLAKNAIWGLYEVLDRLRAFRTTLDRVHPVLPGGEQLEPYKLVTAPIAPHTVPEEAHLILDRRLLPGTTPEEAVEQVRKVVGQLPPFEIEVSMGACHMSYQLSSDLPIVQALARSYATIRTDMPEIGYLTSAFDAGYANYRGIPTVMFGPSSRPQHRTGREVLASEFVPLSEVHDFAKIYALTILTLLQ